MHQLTGASHGQIDGLFKAGMYSWPRLATADLLDAKTKRWKLDALAEVVRKTKGLPGVVAWNLLDEPEVHRITPDALKEAYDTIRRTDPNHPVIVNLCQSTRFAEFIGATDVASYDHYPFPIPHEFGWIRRANRTMRELTGGRKPLLAILQTYGGSPGRAKPPENMPTLAQLRASMYAFICDGATMFAYYSWYDRPPTRCLVNHPEMRSYTRVLNDELRELRPLLFSAETLPTPTIRPKHDYLACLARRVGDHVEMVVVNPSPRTIRQIELSLAAGPIRAAQSVFEDGRPVVIRSGRISDTLGPYGVHVYRLRLAPETP